jgi:hypothetical protein
MSFLDTLFGVIVYGAEVTQLTIIGKTRTLGAKIYDAELDCVTTNPV